jgi:HSP20 family protein
MSKTEKTQPSGAGKEIEAGRPAPSSSPFEEVNRVFFDRWFENFFPRSWLRPLRMDWPSWAEMAAPLMTRMPKVDVIDRDNEVLVRAAVPGVEKDGLDVSVSDNTVTLKGETKHEEKEEKGDYYRSEISRGAFTRTIMLPDRVASEGARAEFENGVLELTLPKVEKAKRHTVKIE